MAAEKVNPSIGIPEGRQGHVRSWDEMKGLIAGLAGQEVENLEPTTRRFLETYFNIQNYIAEHQLEEANKLFNAELRSRKEYPEFENQNQFLLIAIDIAVKKRSGWTEDY